MWLLRLGYVSEQTKMSLLRRNVRDEVEKKQK